MKTVLTKQEATDFFSKIYYGEHHIPGYEVKENGYGYCVHHDVGGLATYDYSTLTRLVLLAHARCYRLEINAIRNGIMKISIWKRDRENNDVSFGHPTIQEAIDKFSDLK